MVRSVCISSSGSLALVLDVEGVRYWSAGMSIRLCITLKKRVS